MNWKLSINVALMSALLAGVGTAHGGDKDTEPVFLKAEIEQLRKERDALQASVLLLQEKLEQARSAEQSGKTQVELLERRCKQLQFELTLAKGDKEVPRAPAESPKFEPPVVALPPATTKPPAPAASPNPRGKITAISSDGVLMQISIGSESGIKEGQTLEVFRLGADNGAQRTGPAYLGTLKLTRVDPKSSLGQFKGATGSIERRVKVGDEVASDLFIK